MYFIYFSATTTKAPGPIENIYRKGQEVSGVESRWVYMTLVIGKFIEIVSIT